MTQHLLQGFGIAVNSRQIHIAKNQRELSDLVFKQQVITTVAAVMNLYWDLVAFNEDVRVKKQALATSERLYNDNKKQVEVGTLAPIEIVRAEAEVASRQQDLTISETQVLQQETILKNALSRNGVASPSVAEAQHRAHRPHANSADRAHSAAAGPDGQRLARAARAFAKPHPGGRPEDQHQGFEERAAAHARPGG